MQRRLIPFSFFLALFTLNFVALSPRPSQALSAGEAAPEFSLPDTQGKTQNLPESKGKYVVLEWFNEGCPYVQKHYKSGNMPTLQKQYTAKGVVWYSIISSAPGKQGHVTAEQANARAKEWSAAPTAILMDAE